MRVLLIFSIIVITLTKAQNVRVSNKVYISDNESYKSTLERGLKAAKSEALTKAGVTEHISEYTNIITSEINDNISEVFNSDLLTHLSGSIKEWNYTINPTKKFDSEKQLFFIEFEILAKVKKYKSKPDPTFKAKIEGLKGSYIDADRIEFSIYPFKECYLNIFYISDNEANILFPYELTQETLIKADEKTIIDYLIAEAIKDNESGRLITVITKEFYPYDSAYKNDDGFETITTVDDVFKWILDIEPENRTEYYHQFVITK